MLPARPPARPPLIQGISRLFLLTVQIKHKEGQE